MAKKSRVDPRCVRIKRSDAEIFWDDVQAPRSNRVKVNEHGLTEDEVESVLLDDDLVPEFNRRHPAHCLIKGYTYTGVFIIVAWEVLDEKTPLIRPITAFSPEPE